MKLQIHLFATLKERAGTAQVPLQLPDGATVADLLDALAQRYPSLAPSLPTALVAVNHTYAARTQPLQPGDEVAIFPPVSGG